MLFFAVDSNVNIFPKRLQILGSHILVTFQNHVHFRDTRYAKKIVTSSAGFKL